MTTPLRPFTSTRLVSHHAHRTADRFCQQQREHQKAEQVYLNTLAVYTVYEYLQEAGLEPDLNQSDSWNPILRNMMNVADLMVPPYGRLECRMVRIDDCRMRVPAETWEDRIAYIAVALDDELEQATLLGFVDHTVIVSMRNQMQDETIMLSDLRPIELLQDSMEQSLEQRQGDTFISALTKIGQWPRLRDWLGEGQVGELRKQVDDTWQTLDVLLGVQALEFQTRSVSSPSKPSRAASSQALSINSRTERISRGKLIDLPSKTEPTALVVQIFPIEPSELLISVKLCPVGTQTHLTADLDVQIRDETGETVIQAQTRNTEMLDIEFSVAADDLFSVAVRLGDSEHVEHFTV